MRSGGIVFNVRSVDVGDTTGAFLPARYRSGRMRDDTAVGLASTVVMAAVALFYHGQRGHDSTAATLTCGFVRSNFSLDIDCPLRHG